MEFHRREFFVSRILYGKLWVGDYYIGQPTWESRLEAQRIYTDTLVQGRLEGLYSLDEVLEILRSEYSVIGYRYGLRLWSDKDEIKTKVLMDDIEKLKIGIFESSLNKAQKEAARVGLRKAEGELSKLLAIRHSLDSMTYEGLAIMYRQMFIVGCSLYRADGQPYFDQGWFYKSISPILQKALVTYSENIISEEAYRDIARNDPWRSIWAARKSDGLFGKPAIELSDEQKNLTLWSQFYDNVYESPDCPPDDVIDDDDALDGWLLVQKKKKETDNLANSIEGKLTDKTRNADEVYVPVGSLEEAQKLDSVNSLEAKLAKRRRLNEVREKGVVNEIDFSDTQAKLRQQLENMKKGKLNDG